MALKIDDFQRDIIVDEVILQNKTEYEQKLLNLAKVKEMLNYYLNDILDKQTADIDFETALGSILNIGKLFINVSNLSEESVNCINSTALKPVAKFEYINNEYVKRNVHMADEIYGIETFSVVPHYVMNNFSYVKLELLKKNKEIIDRYNVDMHKISRVIELFMDKYRKAINPNEMGIRMIGEIELFALCNLYLKLILHLYSSEDKNIFGGSVYTLSEFINRPKVHINDISFFINSYPQIKDFCYRTLQEQLELSIPFHWFPNEVIELQRLSIKVFNLAKKIRSNSQDIPTRNECEVIGDKVLDNVDDIKFTLDNKYKKYYNVGINLGGDFVFEVVDKLIDRIENDIDYICGDTSSLDDTNRECMYYGNDSMLVAVFNGLNDTK